MITFNDLMKVCRGLLLLLSFIAFPFDAMADSQKALALDEMTDLADEIVVGKVVSNEARWQGRLIITVSAVEVQETIKGSPSATVEITQLGGTAFHPKLKTPVNMSVSSSAVLQAGEEVMLFVRRTPEGRRDLIGGHQGKFSVTTEELTGDKVIPVGPKEISVLKKDSRRTLSSKHITLNEMRQRIKDHINKGERSGK